MTELVPWIVVALALAMASGLYLRVRAAGVEAEAARSEAEKLRGELAAAREQLARSGAKQRKAAEESQTLRRKLDKAKRRTEKTSGGHGATATRLNALEADLEQTRQARDAAREEAQGLASELARLRSAEKRVPVTVPAPADEAALAALSRRAEAAESELASLREQLAEHVRTVERLRGRARTQETLYASIRAELAAKKDRLRAQQEEIERLQALKVALIDAPAAEQGASSAEPESH
jgi:chromosome segregation ATPase